mgnify:CR=1 FL=1
MSKENLKKIGQIVNNIEETSIALCLGLMTLITFANVVARYLFNDNILWAEFKIFPNQMRIIKQGQKVIIDDEVFSIAHIIPNQNNEPFELARVRLDNHDHGWRAGVTLKADVITQSKTAKYRSDGFHHWFSKM